MAARRPSRVEGVGPQPEPNGPSPFLGTLNSTRGERPIAQLWAKAMNVPVQPHEGFAVVISWHRQGGGGLYGVGSLNGKCLHAYLFILRRLKGFGFFGRAKVRRSYRIADLKTEWV